MWSFTPDKLEPRKKIFFSFFLWKDISILLKMLHDTKGENIFNSIQPDPIETITCSFLFCVGYIDHLAVKFIWSKLQNLAHT